MLGFDSYRDMSEPPAADPRRARRASATCRRDRRTLLPLSPVERQLGLPRGGVALPGPRRRRRTSERVSTPASGPRVIRARLDGRPWAPLKIASGCDRRCSFCAIPMFRGAFVSRRPADVVAEARWLARAGRQGALPRQRELHVLRQGPRRPRPAREAAARADRRRGHRAGAGVLPAAGRDPARPAERDGRRPRASCPTTTSPSSTRREPLLRRMRRFGGARGVPRPARRACAPRAPLAGVRCNVIVGFPGETEADLDELEALPRRGPPRRGRRLRLLRRGRHRGRGPTTASCPTRSSPSGVERFTAPRRGAQPPSGPRSASASASWCSSRRSTTRTARGRRRPGRTTRGPTSTASTLVLLRAATRRRRSVTSWPAVVVGTEGIDLVAEPR